MKHTHDKLLLQLWNIGRDEGCCTSEMKRCIASAQATGNHAILSMNQCSPYTAAHRKKSITLFKGEAMVESEIRAMNSRIHYVQTKRAAALEARAAVRATHPQDPRADFKAPAGGNARNMGLQEKGDPEPDATGGRYNSKRQRCRDGGQGKGKVDRDPRK
ncbi:unnamed protein product [Ectocarpus sp. 12 AP-2014]